MRAIDEETLIDSLAELTMYNDHGKAMLESSAVMHRVHRAPTLGPVTVWTPVEKGMPPKEGFYLVTSKINKTAMIWFDKRRRWIVEPDTDVSETVIAWAPMPAPYKAVMP